MSKNLGLLFVEEEEEEEEQDRQEERLKIEADVLRAECKFLRMERDLAFRKLEESQGRKKIDRSRRLMVEISTRRRRRRERPAGIGSNFDRNASVVRRQLADENRGEKEIREVASSAGTSIVPPNKAEQDVHVEMLRRKMEGMSKGMLQRVEECGSLLSLSANGSSNGHYQRQVQGRKLERTGSGSCCCNCKCKQVVARIAEQVKAEKEHWTEMQQMLDQVRVEMEDLRSSRDHWQCRAIASELELRTRHHNMIERKHACNSLNISSRNEGLNAVTNNLSLTRANYLDTLDTIRLPKIKCQQKQQEQRLPDFANREREKEKRVLICHLNGSKMNSTSRTPLHDVSNSFPEATKHATMNNLRRDFASRMQLQDASGLSWVSKHDIICDLKAPPNT